MQAVNRVSIQLTLSTSTTSGYACDLHLRTAKRVNQGMSEQARRVGSASWCWRVVLRVTRRCPRRPARHASRLPMGADTVLVSVCAQDHRDTNRARAAGLGGRGHEELQGEGDA